VALRIERVFGPLVRAHYVNRLIPEARDLLALCRELPPEDLFTSRKRRICRAVADVVAALHNAGILHADLNLQNILVRDPLDDPEAFIVDLDRACVFGDLDLPQRMSNLVRLDRSVEKWPESRSAIGLTDRVAFMRAYLGRHSEWAESEEEIIRRHGSRHLRHRPWRKG
jgi:tRNA A-37 threonylcarbamoyl transferase component Bud32